MGDTTFFGDVRATEGFKHVAIAATTGTETELEIVNSDGLVTAAGGITTSASVGLTGAVAITGALTTSSTLTSSGVATFTGNAGQMTAGTGITTGTGTVYSASVMKQGQIVVTRIYVDITGLNDGDTSGDVIGKDGDTVNCNLGQITTAINGVIMAGTLYCGVAPTGGHADIDIFTSTDGTLAQDTAISAGAGQAQMVAGDTLAVADQIPLTALPANAAYLYLTTGTQGSDADYTAGKIVIELIGFKI